MEGMPLKLIKACHFLRVTHFITTFLLLTTHQTSNPIHTHKLSSRFSNNRYLFSSSSGLPHHKEAYHDSSPSFRAMPSHFSVATLFLPAVESLAPIGGDSSRSSSASRRNFLETAKLGTLSVILSSFVQPSNAASNGSAPFCVIGANGRTGTKCVQRLLQKNIPVRATSRGGIYNEGVPEGLQQSLLSPTICDVTDPSTIATAVSGTRAVIFAASASKAGGTPAQVDNVGLVNVAKACLDAKVPHLVIVSSGGVSKPDSPVYKFLNIFGSIMEQKIIGEDTVRDLYAKANSNECTYTVVRPGGLTEEPSKGVSALELNQGDAKSGRISRYDVADICIEATVYPQSTGGTTFECYDADTGKPLSSVGMSNIMKQTSETPSFISGKERRGSTWEQLFKGLEKDAATS